MKSVSWLLVFPCLFITTLFAQTTTSKRATTTQTSSTTAVSNRQQELYDQYHGYNKKAGAATTGTSLVDKPTAKQRPVEKVAASSNPQPASATTNTNEPSLKKSKSQPTTQPVAVARENTLRRSESIEGNPSSRFRIGIRGGVTYPYYINKNPFVDPVMGFVGGITFTLGTGVVSFQPEINYVRNSFKLSDFNQTPTYATDAVQVPLLLKFSTGSYASSRFFFTIGPYASYETSASIDGKKYSLSNTGDRLSFGAAAGIGAAIKAGPGHVTVEVRGLYLLADTDNGLNTDSKIILGQGTIGYMFPLGGAR